MTSALHAEDRQFKPGQEYFYFLRSQVRKQHVMLSILLCFDSKIGNGQRGQNFPLMVNGRKE
jgi:hypothetical protein